MCSVHLDADLAPVLARPLILVRLLNLVEGEDFGVNNGPKSLRVSLNCAAHIFHHAPVSDENAPCGAKSRQVLKESWLILGLATHKPDDGDDAVHLDAGKTLSHRGWACDFDNMVDTNSTSQLLGLVTPLRRFIVVDDVIRAELL